MKKKNITQKLIIFVCYLPILLANNIDNLDLNNNIKINSKNCPKNNFDWEYYVEHNNLSIDNEEEALEHYKNIGKRDKLSYCKPLTIAILLHLYELNLIDEFIDDINYFMKNNHENQFYIKVTIPIDNNINEYHYINSTNPLPAVYTMKELVLKNFCYNKALIQDCSQVLFNDNDILKLYHIYQYLLKSFNIDKKRIQIIFTENKGVDIGGFFIALDQLLKQKIDHDFIIKIHSKKNTNWRRSVLSFLNIPINNLLKRNQALYSRQSLTACALTDCAPFLMPILDGFDIPFNNKSCHSSGNMFITAKESTYFFKEDDLLSLVNKLPYKRQHYHTNVGYELFFGCLIDYLNLKVGILEDILEKIDNDI